MDIFAFILEFMGFKDFNEFVITVCMVTGVLIFWAFYKIIMGNWN